MVLPVELPAAPHPVKKTRTPPPCYHAPVMHDRSDHELLESARAGDARALETLLERHQTQVYRFGMKMCRDPEDAREVLQDTLLAAARGIRDFRGASSISTWLYTVARSFCIKHRRKGGPASRQARSLDEEDTSAEVTAIADAGKTPEEALAQRQIERALEQAISRLDPAQREVLVLRDMEGLTAPEVAEVLGVSVQAVKSRLHRARLAVRAELAPLLGVPTEPATDAATEAATVAAPAPPSVATCPDVLTLFSRHLEDEISADVCAEMERHLRGCPRCRGACESLQRTLATCRTAPSPEVPPAVQRSVRTALRSFLTLPPSGPPARPDGSFFSPARTLSGRRGSHRT